MGSQIKAKCNCGYQKLLTVGTGMQIYKHTDYFIGFCEGCNELSNVNVMSKKFSCGKCNSEKVYLCHSKKVEGIEHGPEILNIKGHKLYSKAYECPSCKNMSLQFTDTGMLWD